MQKIKNYYIEVRVRTLGFMNYNLEEEDTISLITLHIPISKYILKHRLLDTLCHWLAKEY